MSEKIVFTMEEIRDIISYDPDTGIMTWKKSRPRGPRAGDEIKYVQSTGYISFRMAKRFYFVHQLAFVYMTGKYPSGMVDHKNGNTTDNRWCNLRDVDRRENANNRQSHRQGKTPGVSYVAKNKSKPWHARMNVLGKSIWLGTYKDKEDAVKMYKTMCDDMRMLGV